MKDVKHPHTARMAAIGVAVLGATALSTLPTTAYAWEPTKSVEFVVPAGTGGGADQMARMIQGVIQKNNLMAQPIVVINKSGGAGAEGFLDVKGHKGEEHKIIITLSNLFTTPLATGVPFSYEDLTPVAMLALDNFVLWVNSDAPQKTAKEYIEAVKAAGPNKFKMGGTGSKQEDQIITVGIDSAAGTKFTYIPYKGGGDVAAQLVGGHINSSVNNPIEAVSQWRAGALTPLCVFGTQRIDITEPVAEGKSWNSIPTCTEAGIPVEYQMLRGIMMAPGVEQEVVDFYVDLFKKVRETAEWKDFMQKGAFDTSFKVGDEFKAWLASADKQHRQLMTEAGLAKK